MQFNQPQAASSSSSKASSPSSLVKRGRACMNCRRRKIRCNNNKPICDQCLRTPELSHHCKYADVRRTRTQILEGIITRLNTRIQELEFPDDRVFSTKSHHEYECGPYPSHRCSCLPQNAAWNNDVPHPLIPEISVPSDPVRRGRSDLNHLMHTTTSQRPASPLDISCIADEPREEPPLVIIQMLLHNFLPHASEFGFFLSIPRFREAALLPLPIGHYSRPSPALLSTVYLWGVHLSHCEPFIARENIFLSSALKQTANTLSGTHPHKILHGIQAEVLLCHYFFRTGNLLEGRQHASTAVSLAIGSGFHKIGTQPSSPAENIVSITGYELLSPIDAMDEGERINAFWTVLILKNCWTVALGSPLTVPPAAEAYGVQVDTPWPSDEDASEQNLLSPIPTGGSTIQNFLNNVSKNSPREFSTVALLAKASILFEQAANLVSQCHLNVQPEKANPLAAEFATLDSLIDRFRNGLPPINQPPITIPSSIRTTVVTHSLAHLAVIHLHNTQDNVHSHQKRLSAAKSVIDIVGKVKLEDFIYIDTIMGTLWVTACQVLIDEISRLRSLHSAWAPGTFSGQEEDLVVTLERGFAALAMFSLDCPLICYQLTKIQEVYMVIN